MGDLMTAGVVAVAAVKIACASEVCRQTEISLGRALDLVQHHFPSDDTDVPDTSRDVVIQMGWVIAKAVADVRKPPAKKLGAT
jgi:hypothetical protein